MRQLSEINKDIDVINNQVKVLEERKEVLYNEKCERLFADFCDKHGVKSGDIVELNNRVHTQLQIIGMNGPWYSWVLCRKIKKNGEPYASTTTFAPVCFDGCKVVKTQED
jgi:hypothetical protein